MKHTTALRLYDLEEKSVEKIYKKIFKDGKYTENVNGNEKIEYWSFEEGTIIIRLLEKENSYIPFDIMEEKDKKLSDNFEDLINDGYAELIEGYFVNDESADDDIIECTDESIFDYIEDEYFNLNDNFSVGYFFISEKDAKIYEKIKEIDKEYCEDESADQDNYKGKIKNAIEEID